MNPLSVARTTQFPFPIKPNPLFPRKPNSFQTLWTFLNIFQFLFELFITLCRISFGFRLNSFEFYFESPSYALYLLMVSYALFFSRSMLCYILLSFLCSTQFYPSLVSYASNWSSPSSTSNLHRVIFIKLNFLKVSYALLFPVGLLSYVPISFPPLFSALFIQGLLCSVLLWFTLLGYALFHPLPFCFLLFYLRIKFSTPTQSWTQ